MIFIFMLAFGGQGRLVAVCNSKN